MTELAKTFDPAAIEARWYAHWESAGSFRPARPDAPPFTIVMPPPNVTGSLHIGHALDVTLQDILVRHARLQGKDALWVAGTDHAGIATQMVVERQMALSQDKRTNYSREDFVAKVWEWKAESGGTITRQLRRLGASCDWANERFTMDKGFSKAVIKVFVELYNEGLLYRDKRLVNWDPGLKTAISDLEVEQREVSGKFWHFRYPLEDGSGFIAIATTRPETILGDGAVAVNPADERYAHLVGKFCHLPIVDRRIPIIADDYVKIDFGSGAVKITAAHDHNDYAVYQRHPDAGIPLINLMNADATMNENCPPDYVGLDRYDARKKVVADFEALGLLDKIEDHVHMVPYGDRSGVVIEPWLTDQWYVDAKTLAGPAIEAVKSGAIKVVPPTWEKTWFQWLENIQPWCVSRQLWWGHRIPAWYADKREDELEDEWDSSKRIFIALDEAELRSQLDAYYADATYSLFDSESDRWASLPSMTNLVSSADYGVHRDSDVLDTWFSSALWPFGTLGWPDAASPSPSGEGLGWGLSASADDAQPGSTSPTPTPPLKGRGLLAKHYPNDVLISGFDILFFWDARMAMQGLHFVKDVPWRTLYLHGLVRAPDGSKMSKSKGNAVDPLGLIDKYGADALRFTLAAMESQGRDIKLDEKRVEGYRNFATKLWNAARFLQGNGVGASASVAAPEAELAVNKWIIGEVVETLAKLDQAIADLRYDAMADAIYHFAWGTFCDWYVELIKGEFQPNSTRTEPDTVRAELVEASSFSSSDVEKESTTLRQAQDERAEETRAVASWAFDQILVMLHPFMPFITEELWHAMGKRNGDLIHAAWPSPNAKVDAEAKADLEWLVTTISAVRAERTSLGIPPGARLEAIAKPQSEVATRKLQKYEAPLQRLARLANIDTTRHVIDLNNHVEVVVEDLSLFLHTEGVFDRDTRVTELNKAFLAAEKEAASLASRLANPSFIERAKPEAVEKARADHAEKSAEADRLRAALARLG